MRLPWLVAATGCCLAGCLSAAAHPSTSHDAADYGLLRVAGPGPDSVLEEEESLPSFDVSRGEPQGESVDAYVKLDSVAAVKEDACAAEPSAPAVIQRPLASAQRMGESVARRIGKNRGEEFSLLIDTQVLDLHTKTFADVGVDREEWERVTTDAVEAVRKYLWTLMPFASPIVVAAFLLLCIWPIMGLLLCCPTLRRLGEKQRARVIYVQPARHPTRRTPYRDISGVHIETRATQSTEDSPDNTHSDGESTPPSPDDDRGHHHHDGHRDEAYYPRPPRLLMGKTLRRILFSVFVLILLASIGVAFASIAWSLALHDGVKETFCALASVADEGLNGSPPDTPQPFMGVLPAVQMLDGLKTDLDPSSPGGVIDSVEASLDKTLDFQANQDELIGRLGFMIGVLEDEKNDPMKESDVDRRTYHACLYCEYGAPILREFNRSLDEGITKGLSDMRSTIKEKLASGSEDLERLTQRLNSFDYNATALSAVTEDVVNSTLVGGRAQVNAVENVRLAVFAAVASLGVAIGLCGLVYLLHVNCAISRLERGRQSTASSILIKPAACLWCSLMAYAVLVLVLGGLVLVLGVATNDTCRWAQTSVLDAEGLTKYNALLGDLSDKAPAVAQQCLTRGGSGDVLAALGVKGQVDFGPEIRKQIDQLDQLKDNGTLDVAPLQSLVASAREFGWLFLPDTSAPSKDGHDVSDVPFEVSLSGIQDKDRRIDESDTQAIIKEAIKAQPAMSGVIEDAIFSSNVTILGLEEYQAIIEPFFFAALQNGWTMDRAMYEITSTFDPDDAIVSTEAQRRAREASNDTDTRREYIRMYENMVWWAVRKQRLRDPSWVSFDCPTWPDESQGSPCSYQEFTAYLVDDLAAPVYEAGERFVGAVDKAKGELHDKLSDVLDGVLSRVDVLLDGLNCKVMYRGAQTVSDRLCERIVPNTVLVALSWVALGALAFISAALFFTLWLNLRRAADCCPLQETDAGEEQSVTSEA
mmetsp:Transcript_33216/g.95842  ORF Transcript_33216/g.95842 Transcript_33216/m.95842 type:complete len:985 (+) Transcript_33216:190-3144(+)